jgi:hypothetical protein
MPRKSYNQRQKSRNKCRLRQQRLNNRRGVRDSECLLFVFGHSSPGYTLNRQGDCEHVIMDR